MNPNVNKRRGCFIRKEPDTGKFTVVDYPTWSFKNYGKFSANMNEPIPEGLPYEIQFATEDEAQAFCEEQNYLVCMKPDGKVRPVMYQYENE